MTLIVRAWIVPSSKRLLTAALTSRCWLILVRPSNCGALTSVSGSGLVDDGGGRTRQGGFDQSFEFH